MYLSNPDTPQNEPLGPEQVANNAGGYVYRLEPLDALRRFLVLGTEGGTYYAGQDKLTRENIGLLVVLANDIERASLALGVIRDYSVAGRVIKNDTCLFALAVFFSKASDPRVRAQARLYLNDIARTASHLFQFVAYCEMFRGWGRAMRRAISDWYKVRDIDTLAYQVVKYRQRNGWSHRDLLRLAHPKAETKEKNALYSYIAKGRDGLELVTLDDSFGPKLVLAADVCQSATSAKRAAELIREFNLPRECVNTKLLNEPDVWEALLERMPMTAMIRNLGKMTSIGLLTPLSEAAKHVCQRLTNKEAIKGARVHPLSILGALQTYKQGHGVRGSLIWSPVSSILDALEEAFELAFDNVEPSGKRVFLALDVSASMCWGEIGGMPGVSPRVASAAMALITARTEEQCHTAVFSHELMAMRISRKASLSDVLETVERLPFGTTDCALPMLVAAENNIPVDLFVVYTDNETWAGAVHPSEALKKYRKKMGIDARLAVVGMTATQFTIADPHDKGMLDVVGFDPSTPRVLSMFANGEL